MLTALKPEDYSRIGGEALEAYFHLHMYPELSDEEAETGRFVAERFTALGLTPKTGIGGHGVTALLKGAKPGPLIAWRADMDAGALQELSDIPYKSRRDGVMHLCGHDAHTAIALGVAEALMTARDELCGSVLFIFQPSEENSQGAKRMIADGAIKDPRPCAVYGLHQGGRGSEQSYMEAGQIALNYGTVLYGIDVIELRIDIARPRINAWAEQELLLTYLRRLNRLELSDKPSQNIIDFEVVQKENHDEEKYVKIRARFRYGQQEYRDIIRDELVRLIRAFEEKTGSAVSLDYIKSTPPVYNREADCLEAADILRGIDGVGLVEVKDEVPPHGSDDFARFQDELSGLFFFLGSAKLSEGLRSQNHTATFRIDEACVPFGVRTVTEFLAEILRRKAANQSEAD